MIGKVDRRTLLLLVPALGASGGAGLALGFWYGQRKERWIKRAPQRPQPLNPSVFWALDTGGLLTVWVPKSEMGQGVLTSLAMIVAEEMDVPWPRVRSICAMANQNFGWMLTANSFSVRGFWDELRQSGALGRIMLVRAAARIWGVDEGKCTTQPGFVVHQTSGRRLAYGDLAVAAGELSVPGSAPLKDPAQYRLLGKQPSPPRLDIPDKVTGQARFGADVRVPGLKYAAVVHAPAGTVLKGADTKPALEVRGVERIEVMDRGVAVIASNTWSAQQGADRVRLDTTPPSVPDAARTRQILQEALDRPGVSAASIGPEPPSTATVQTELFLPYLPHLNMEPANATAWVEANRCRIWAPTQAPRSVHHWARDHLGLEEAQVEMQPTLVGTGFGRRGSIDEVQEAVELSRRLRVPVQVTWSRTEDLRQDKFRPVSLHRLGASLDGDGLPTAWEHRIASPSLVGAAPDTLDGTAVEGAIDLPYGIASVRVSWHRPEGLPLPVGFWRSVGHSYNAFAVETFVDELAEKAGVDPGEYRLRLLRDRHRAVLERAMEAADWGLTGDSDRVQGLAVHESFESVVAQVVELRPTGSSYRVERVVAAVDCGVVVHRDTVEAQIEGAIAFALSAAMYGNLDVKDGRVTNSNFHDAPVLRLPDMPSVEVHLLDRPGARPGGVGEIGVPPLAPALANAVAALTGHRPRSLPLRA